MTDLRQRLARFDRPTGPRISRPPDAQPLRRLLAAGARWCGEAPTGYLKIERDLGGDLPVQALEQLAPGWPPGDVLVLDTETTGLESGTGTLVFVVGFVRCNGEGQRLVQYFLPEPAAEPAFLEAVLGEFGTAAGILSYNGRGFDIPRLRSRVRLQRLGDQALDLPHLDLLYLTRRLTRGWLPDARLKTVEEQLLGEMRDDDLPGEFAPEVYRCLQLERRDTGLQEVVRHNAMDVESLPRLALFLSSVLAGEGLDGIPTSGLLELARLKLERGERPDAERLLDRVRAGSSPAPRTRALALLAGLRRRDGDYPAAAALWGERIAGSNGDLKARVELAKLLEHRIGDLERARTVVDEARTLVRLRDHTDPDLCAALDHRYRRLVRKLGRRR